MADFHIEALYPNGWETEITADTQEEADELLADYTRNVPGRQHRIRKVVERDPDAPKTYKVIRFYESDDMDREVIMGGLTLEQAQGHCNDPESSSRTATNAAGVQRTQTYGGWFDGWEEE